MPSPTTPPSGTVIKRSTQLAGQWTGGTTNAIYAYPSTMLGAMAQARFWIGTAAIVRSAPYSHFANRQRVHLPVRGNGLQLHFQEPTETVTLPTFAQARFAGDRPVQAALIDGPVDAFNLIFAPDVAATVRVIQNDVTTLTLPLPAESSIVTNAVHVLYVVNGEVAIGLADHPVAELTSGEAFVIEEGAVHPSRSLSLALQWTQPAAVVVATVSF